MTIRPWARGDMPALRPMLHDFLEANVAAGGDLEACAPNVEALLELGLRLADAGEPVLVAVADDGGLAGFVMWGELPTPLRLRWRTATAFGSFTWPAYRHQGVAAALRTAAHAICVARGVERVMGPLHRGNRRGVEVFRQDWDARICQVVLEGWVNGVRPEGR